MYPDSHKISSASNAPKENNKAMKVASEYPDLELLANNLQAQLCAEIPSGEFYKVKCVVKNDRLMILIQHPQNISVDTEDVFAVLEEALKSLLPPGEQIVELFCRVAGEKLPYSKTELRWSRVETSGVAENGVEIEVVPEVEEIVPEAIPIPSFLSDDSISETPSPPESSPHGEEIPIPSFLSDDLISETPSPPESSPQVETEPEIQVEAEAEEKPFDPFLDEPDLTYYPKPKNKLALKALIVGGILLTVTVLGGAGYALTRPCVLSQCTEIQTAEKLQGDFQQIKNNPPAETKLAGLKSEMESAIASLETIPSWSSRHQQAQQLQGDLSTRVEKLNLVLAAFAKGKQAAQIAPNSNITLQELEKSQQLWRQAITPLETINPKSELYNLVQAKLSSYRQGLQAVNQQLLAEEKWQKKVADAQAVAIVAAERENSAKTLPELQKMQSTWQVAVNALVAIPRNSAAYSQAQQLLDEYKPKLANARVKTTKELLASKTYNQAVNAANSAKSYEKQNQWSAAVTNWNEAVDAIKRVASDSLYYNQAQPLRESYTKSLKLAEQQLDIYTRVQKARADLGRTCTSNIRICTFTVTPQAIAVRITPEYAQAISFNSNNTDTNSYMNNSANVTNHLQKVQEALEVISDNASMPLTIYDHLGNQTYVHQPRS